MPASLLWATSPLGWHGGELKGPSLEVCLLWTNCCLHRPFLLPHSHSIALQWPLGTKPPVCHAQLTTVSPRMATYLDCRLHLHSASFRPREINVIELNWIELDCIKLNWTMLNWTKLNWIGLNQTELNYAELNWTDSKGTKRGCWYAIHTDFTDTRQWVYHGNRTQYSKSKNEWTTIDISDWDRDW